MDLGLERIHRLLEALQHPEKLDHIVHVAGTNGKGSTCAYISSVLLASQQTVGRFNSPHLLEPRDSIQINGQPVSQDLYDRARQHVAAVNAPIQATAFEQLVATALCLFRDAGVAWAVMEVGLGGTLDATNVFTCPDITIITALAMDHAAVLGNTIQAIATAKAGIMKPGCPAVFAPQEDPDALLTLQAEAERHHAPYVVASPAIWVDASTRVCRVRALTRDVEFVIPLHGDYQRENAAVAVAALAWLAERGRWTWTDEAVQRGMASTRWPGRLDWVEGAMLGSTPLPPLLVDGAHNPQAARALRRYVDRTEPVVWILGVTAGKDIADMLRTLLKPNDVLLAVPFSQPAGMPWIQSVPPSAIVQVRQGHAFDSLRAALDYAARHHAQDYIVLCGSLYLAADFYRLVLPS